MENTEPTITVSVNLLQVLARAAFIEGAHSVDPTWGRGLINDDFAEWGQSLARELNAPAPEPGTLPVVAMLSHVRDIAIASQK